MKNKRKPTGDWLEPLSAIARLMQLSIEWIASMKPGVRVKWDIRLHYKTPEMIITRSFSSGKENTAEEMLPPEESAPPIEISQ